MNKQVVEITEENRNIKCDYCDKSTINSLEWGPMYQYGGVTVHYFCLLFSAGLSQNGEDDQGILGFLPVDIKKELRRGDKLKCKFCKKPRATIGCSVKTCKFSYHYPCGLHERSVFQFTGNFESYCEKHKEDVPIPLARDEWECPICFVNVEDDDLPLWPPCCKKRVFHKTCIMEMAKNHGAHFFKCPLCNDRESFIVAMRKSGVYLPDRDATWETGNAFEDHARQYTRCDASDCLCPKGRGHDSKSESKPWKIVRCGACGAAAIHKFCGNLNNLTWRCDTCSRILSDRRRSDVHNSSRIQRHHFDTSSDEEIEMSTVSRVNDAIVPPPPASSESSDGVQSEGFVKMQSLAQSVKNFPFFERERRKIVDEDVTQNVDNAEASSDSDSEDSDESSEDFISPEAEERLKQRCLAESNKLSLIRSITARPTTAIASEKLTKPPSFAPTGRDNLIRTRVLERIKTVRAQEPEIISELEKSAKIRISLQGVSGVSTPTDNSSSDQQEIIILDPDPVESFPSSKEKDLAADDDSSDIEVISEKVVPVTQTKSSILQEILNGEQGDSRKKVNQPVVRLGLDDHENDSIRFDNCSWHKVTKAINNFSPLQFRPPVPISNAFLKMIYSQKNKKAGISDESQNSKRNKPQDHEVEIVSLDSDDETDSDKTITGDSTCTDSTCTDTTLDLDENISKKRDRLDSPGPSSPVGISKRSRV